MRPIIVTQFGSHVYGTNIPTSDHDYKGVFIPTARDIVLQRAPRQILTNTKSDQTKRNTADDVDRENFSLHQYFKLLIEGQTPALDLLFTPEKWWVHGGGDISEWMAIRRFAMNNLLHRGTAAFVGYTQQQAAKYGIKGSRVAAVRAFLEEIRVRTTGSEKLYEIWPRLKAWAPGREHVEFVIIKNPAGVEEEYLSICNRKVNGHVTVKYANEIFTRIFEEWGERAKQAESNEGVDWKALMHAVRVAGEAEELLLTGKITFPRPDADFLLKIRTGQLAYKQVAEIIEGGLQKIAAAKEKSILPDEPNRKAADDFVYETYRREVAEAA